MRLETWIKLLTQPRYLLSTRLLKPLFEQPNYLSILCLRIFVTCLKSKYDKNLPSVLMLLNRRLTFDSLLANSYVTFQMKNHDLRQTKNDHFEIRLYPYLSTMGRPGNECNCFRTYSTSSLRARIFFNILICAQKFVARKF